MAENPEHLQGWCNGEVGVGKGLLLFPGEMERKGALIYNLFIPQLGMGYGSLLSSASEVFSLAASWIIELQIAHVFLSLLLAFCFPRHDTVLCPSWFFGVSPVCNSSAGKAPTWELSLILFSLNNALGALMLLDQTLLPISDHTQQSRLVNWVGNKGAFLFF